jgi:hypothetical protein
MSREIAGAIVEDELKELRALSYRELAERVSGVRSDGRAGPDGNEYQGETEVRWDRQGQRRYSRDGGCPRSRVGALSPLAGAFIMRADGSLLDENPN